MSKLIDDTLKVKGNFSMKRIAVAVTFPNALTLGWYIVLSDRYIQTTFPIQIFDSLLLFCTSAMGLIIAGALKNKFLNNGNVVESTENIEIIERTESSTTSKPE